MFIKSTYLVLKNHLAFVTWGFKILRVCLCSGYGWGNSSEVGACVWYVSWHMCSSMWNNSTIAVHWGRWGAQQRGSVTDRDSVLALFYPSSLQLSGLNSHSCCCLLPSKRAGELSRIWTCWTSHSYWIRKHILVKGFIDQTRHLLVSKPTLASASSPTDVKHKTRLNKSLFYW